MTNIDHLHKKLLQIMLKETVRQNLIIKTAIKNGLADTTFQLRVILIKSLSDSEPSESDTSELKKLIAEIEIEQRLAAMPNGQKLSHAAGDFRQPETRSGNGQA